MADVNADTFLAGLTVSRFQPIAYFDQNMDCIRVLTHDRSVVEHRLNEYYTIHEVTNPGRFDPQYAGFTIKGVKHLFSEVGIPLDRAYKLADVIDKLVKYKPGSVLSESLKLIFMGHAGAGDLPVDMRWTA